MSVVDVTGWINGLDAFSSTNGVDLQGTSTLHVQNARIDIAYGVAGFVYGVRNRGSSAAHIESVYVSLARGGGFAYGISNEDSSTPTLNQVTVVGESAGGFLYGMRNSGNTVPVLNDVTIRVTSSGFSAALYNNGNLQSFMMRNSSIQAIGSIPNAIESSSNSEPMRLVHTLLDGTLSLDEPNDLVCLGVYTPNAVELNGQCQ